MEDTRKSSFKNKKIAKYEVDIDYESFNSSRLEKNSQDEDKIKKKKLILFKRLSKVFKKVKNHDFYQIYLINCSFSISIYFIKIGGILQ